VILDRVRSAQLDIATRSIEAYNRGDLEAVLALVADDVVFVVPDAFANAGTYRGPEGVAEMLDGWNEAWEEFRIEMQAAYLMRVRDGRVTHWRICESKDEAVREAGSP
jgi:ketosteroid isomerase-like protein